MNSNELQDLVDAKIESAKKRSEELSLELKKKIDYHTFTERDEKGEITGKVFTAFTQAPHILVAAKAMDQMLMNKDFEAGQILWVSCVLDKSDPEIDSVDKYKLGLMGMLGRYLDIQAPDVKKS